MKIHVLPGDALTETFVQTNLEGETVICRECTVEGDVRGEDLEDFWQTRASFIEKSYGEPHEKYFQNVRAEFEKLRNPAVSEINLWFEHELFCQTNLWFCLYFLQESNAEIFRVAPFVKNENEIWKGFGAFDAGDLEKCFANRVKLTKEDVALGARLWKAFQNEDFQTLENLSETDSPSFPYLKEACRAAADKSTRPEHLLRGITASGKKDFSEIFTEFSEQAGVYGFGDSQVKRILERESRF